MTLKVINSPFSDSQIKLLNELLPSLTVQQKNWLNGYLTATLAQEDNVEKITVEKITEPNKTITATILYGSQTGNAKALAVQFADELGQNNIEVEVSSMADFPTKKLKKVENLLIVTSTQGEGDAPDNAKSFLDFLHSPRVPNLNELKYSVLALGDTSYDLFCKTGIDFDEQLANLGATAITTRVNCDLDFQDDAEKWFTDIQQQLLKQSAVGATIAKQSGIATQSTSLFSRKNPFYAEILEKINLNMTGSNKATYHLELSLEGSGIQFAPGDSLGVFPTNNIDLVEAILKELNIDENQKVQLNGQQVTIGHALTHELEITVLTKPLFEKLGELEVPNSKWREGRDLLDAIKEYEFSIDAQQLADSLRKLPPRLYSIASSYDANPEEVHLTIGLVTYDIEERSYQGVTSGLIANDLEVGDKLPIFIQQNDHFRLPADDKKIIMIGAGTGIAPFRSFVEQREETAAIGESWLFFGEQYFVTDFLYQLEWQRYLKAGVLSKMTVAFSRDQEEKIYVQHRILEEGAAFYNWLEQGATIFICGDEKYMANDVQTAILAVIEKYGNKTVEQAQQYLDDLTQQKRYLRDVY